MFPGASENARFVLNGDNRGCLLKKNMLQLKKSYTIVYIFGAGEK